MFEPRYLALVESAISGSRLIGMIQPVEHEDKALKPALSQIGCAGRITAYRETEDGRYLITLTGICRFPRGGGAGHAGLVPRGQAGLRAPSPAIWRSATTRIFRASGCSLRSTNISRAAN